MKIVTIVGARPQFIKSAVVSRIFSTNEDIKEIIVHTGQHYDINMSDIFFEEMSIPRPDYNLQINSLGHGAMTGRMLEKIEQILLLEKPDWVLVYGDTNSTLAGALAARKMNIKLAHVEAGLRSYNMEMPEEVNRILTDRISNILFCPTQQAVENLTKEGFLNFNTKIVCNGDVMQDAAIFYSNKCTPPSIQFPKDYILCTIHRAENTNNVNNLRDIFETLEEISDYTPVILPLHPRTKGKLNEINYDFIHSKIVFIEPVGYLEMIYMLKHCKLVMTDSGGLQKEAYFFNKYCITLRSETEWTELLDNGFNTLVGLNKAKIFEAYYKYISISPRGFENKLYGNGDAGNKILSELLNFKN